MFLTELETLEEDARTEPPVEDFESGFIGATDEELWSTLDAFRKEEARRGRGTSFEKRLVALLDQTSATSNTVRMLYKRKYEWRVNFKDVLGVTPHMPEDEEYYLDPNNRDEHGVLDLKKISDAKGTDWPPPTEDS